MGMGMLPFTLAYADYSTVYNSLSFVMASMMASTVYFFFHAHLVSRRYRTALCISGLVTLIAFYHSYRYMDWLLTVPLLLIELLLVMDLDKPTETALSVKLGGAAALMILLGYPGEITLDHGTRWLYWFLAMLPFSYIVWTLFVGLKQAVDKQDPAARSLVSAARYVTVISWCTYPIVYVLPMLGFDTSTQALVGIQVGYSISDFVSKCVVGLMVTKIGMAKSKADGSDGRESLLGGQGGYSQAMGDTSPEAR